MAGLDLGQQVGPLPLGAWVVVVGGGLGIAWYTRRSGAAEPTTVDDTSGQPGVGDGSVGGWVSTAPPSSSPSNTVDTKPTTNEEWGQQAINWLIGQNYDPVLADNSIRSYLSGAPLSISGNTLVGLALTHLGSPPSPLPVPDGSGTPPVKTPIPTGTTTPKPPASTPTPVKQTPVPAPKPAPSAVKFRGVYTVERGDTLWALAKKYYGNGALWGKIYAANRSVIHNPNLIQPGWKLKIPY